MLQKQNKDIELLEKIFKKYNISYKEAEDGIAKINGMPVDEYAKKISKYDEDICVSKNLCNQDSELIDNLYGDIPTTKLDNVTEIAYEEYEEYNEDDEFILAA